jgi:hypothetical protein
LVAFEKYILSIDHEWKGTSRHIAKICVCASKYGKFLENLSGLTSYHFNSMFWGFLMSSFKGTRHNSFAEHGNKHLSRYAQKVLSGQNLASLPTSSSPTAVSSLARFSKHRSEALIRCLSIFYAMQLAGVTFE